MKKMLKNRKGFTLVELMVVVAILGILVAVAVPVYNNVTTKAENQVNEANCRTIESAISQISTLNDGTYPDALIAAATVDLTKDTAVGYPGKTDATLGDFFADGELPAAPKGTITYTFTQATGKVTYAIS